MTGNAGNTGNTTGRTGNDWPVADQLPAADGGGVSGSRGVLPVGIQTFRKVRESGGFYVDKTAFAARMTAEGTHYFLSRPRRFGKSVFTDTLKELFEGNEELFKGLEVHDSWDWSVRHPVVRLDFSGGSYRQPGELRVDLINQLEDIAESAGMELSGGSATACFRRLLKTLHLRSGRRVVVLVDEYDRPILDVLGTPETATANRDFLHDVYSVVKFADMHIRFVFLTGVSKFSKVSLFSGLNNLDDITLNPVYSSVCGFTEAELDRVFSAELEGLDRQAVRKWYNGYCWLGEEKVYNPFDVLKLLKNREFDNYWFETGSPSFLVDTLMERAVPTLRLGGCRGQQQDAVGVRRGSHRGGSAAVPIRVPDRDRQRKQRVGTASLPAGLPEPRGTTKPQ